MKEVVHKEVVKWLNAGVIYPISDNSWVSPVQVVPKKGGITVIMTYGEWTSWDLSPLHSVTCISS